MIEGDLSVSSSSDLQNMSLPSLRNVTGDVTISSCDELTEVSLPALEVVGGSLYVRENHNGDFSSFDMSALRRVGCVLRRGL